MSFITQDNARRLTALLSYGLFPSPMDPTLFAGADEADWRRLYDAATARGVAPMAFSGMMSLPALLKPEDGRLISEWKSASAKNGLAGEWVLRLQTKLLERLNSAGIPALVMRGADICALYPAPALRSIGGIELLVSEDDYRAAVRALTDDGCTAQGAVGVYSTELARNGTRITVSSRPLPPGEGESRAALELCLSDAVTEPSRARLFGSDFPIMSAERECVMLLADVGDRLCEGRAALLELCDWAMFVGSMPEPELWKRWFTSILPASGLSVLAVYLTACAERYLELRDVPWSVSVSESGVERLFAALIDPQEEKPPVQREEKPAKRGLSGLLRSITGKKPPAEEDETVEIKPRRAIVTELRLFESHLG